MARKGIASVLVISCVARLSTAADTPHHHSSHHTGSSQGHSHEARSRHDANHRRALISSSGDVHVNHLEDFSKASVHEGRRLMRATASSTGKNFDAMLLEADPLSAKFGRGCNKYTAQTCTHTKCPDWRDATCEAMEKPEGGTEKHCMCPAGMCQREGACFKDDRLAAHKQDDTLITADGGACPRFFADIKDEGECAKRAEKMGFGKKQKFSTVCKLGTASICKLVSGGGGSKEDEEGESASGGGDADEADEGDMGKNKKDKEDEDYAGDEGEPKVRMDVSHCTYVQGEGNGACPSDSVPAEKWECATLDMSQGGLKGEPFVVDEPESPKGCYGYQGEGGEEFYWNKNKEGEESMDSNTYCRSCGDKPTPKPTDPERTSTADCMIELTKSCKHMPCPAQYGATSCDNGICSCAEGACVYSSPQPGVCVTKTTSTTTAAVVAKDAAPAAAAGGNADAKSGVACRCNLLRSFVVVACFVHFAQRTA